MNKATTGSTPLGHPTTGSWPPHVVTLGLGGYGDEPVSIAVFHATAATRGYRATENRSWAVAEDSTERVKAAATELLFEEHGELQESIVLDWGACCVLVSLERRRSANAWLTLQAAGRRIADVREALDEIRPLLPDSPPEDDLVAVRFWMNGPDEGASLVERRLAAPRWHEVAANYPPSTRRELAAAMSDLDALARRGRVLLWHGPPGTGKTYAIRALAREHAAVATLDCILEPDLFFGQGASHLVEVLEGRHQPDDDRWRILVLEDADELVSADAKLRSGQGMSRLLNLADGLLGQALRVLVVITTNEPITGFHPAVVRPGRCGSLVGFQRFSPQEAREWLEREGNVEAVNGPATLAQLFAMTAGLPTWTPERQVGFHPAPAPVSVP
ncbi:MAG: AAA family ATPase [Candidatus Dormibacteria bacterium]